MTTEHLYRDDEGAASERIAQLEEEKARLVGELERLTGTPRRASRRSIAPYLMLVTMTLAMLSSLAASERHARSGGDHAPLVSSPCRP